MLTNKYVTYTLQNFKVELCIKLKYKFVEIYFNIKVRSE